MHQQMIEGQWTTAFAQFVDDLVTFPAAILKGPVVRGPRADQAGPVRDHRHCRHHPRPERSERDAGRAGSQRPVASRHLWR